MGDKFRDWIDSLPADVRNEIILLDEQIFKLAVGSQPTAAMALVGGGQRVAVHRIIQPVMAMNPSGKLVPLINSSNVMPVTEASAASIASSVTSIRPSMELVSHPMVGTFVGYLGDARADAAALRIGRAVINCDGAGSYANASLVAALAGYYGVCKIVSVKSNANVVAGAASLIFESPAATPALPSVEVNPALTANVRSVDWLGGLIITHATLVDNQAIVVDLAGWGAGTIVEIMFEYWYET